MKYSREGDESAAEARRDDAERGRRPLFMFRGKLSLMMAGTTLVMLVLIGLVMMSVTSMLLKRVSVRGYELVTANAGSVVGALIDRWQRTLLDEATQISIGGRHAPDDMRLPFRALLDDKRESDGIYDIYFINDADGVMTSGTGYVMDGTVDFRTRDYYRAAAASSETYFSPPYTDADTGRTVITLAKSVHDGTPAGRLVGVLAIDVFTDTVSRVLHGLPLPESSYCFMIDESGAVIEHPDSRSAGEGGAVTLESPKLAGYSSIAKMISEHHSSGNKPEAVTFTDYDGEERTFYAHHAKDGPWHLVAAISAREIGDYTSELTRTFMMLSVAAVVVTAVASYLASTVISYSLNSLIDRIIGDPEEPR